MITLEDVVQLVAEVLQLGDQVQNFDENTQLLGAIPEFDSMAVVSVITAVEENFGLEIDDNDITAEIFETLGSLHQFLERASA